MERIRALIEKLQQQAERQGDIAAMMVTVQLLQAELTKASAASSNTSSSKISVVLPGNNRSFYADPAPAAEPEVQQPAKLPVRSETPVVSTQKSDNHDSYRPVPLPVEKLLRHRSGNQIPLQKRLR